MLILTRKKDEAIRIGNNIYIKVVDVSGSQVKIGIEAPSDIPIFREELFESVRKDNVAALANEKPLLENLPEFIKKTQAK